MLVCYFIPCAQMGPLAATPDSVCPQRTHGWPLVALCRLSVGQLNMVVWSGTKFFGLQGKLDDKPMLLKYLLTQMMA